VANLNKRKLSEEEIDQIVIEQADDDSAWEKPIQVKREFIIVPAELAKRATFFAQLHHESSAEDWINRIIQERLDMEEAAFAELKRELSAKNSNF
jgi:hypothetical protein